MSNEEKALEVRVQELEKSLKRTNLILSLGATTLLVCVVITAYRFNEIFLDLTFLREVAAFLAKNQARILQKSCQFGVGFSRLLGCFSCFM